jgi:hypothetical protein
MADQTMKKALIKRAVARLVAQLGRIQLLL